MSSTRRLFLGTATTSGAILTAGCLALLDVEGEEPKYISLSNRHEDPVTIDLTITDAVTGDVVYDETLDFDGFAGADEDGSPPRKQPDLGIGEGFEATVTAATDQDSDELTDDIGPSAGSWINVLHGSDAELSISRDIV
ncbi:hypothetical protein [Natronobacterium gregoryi]|uniref:Uncharacterized protein n=2 Tax=Natronobacterium gregoryi TaxID=44930 RepID=L0AFP6_NATGS|nr:hypothetical protein [Natronobacterium gregoryi]AFZ72626.1 hypothetical protein Natgr_1415 [Natronobacterium gregoryi SP2]ELY69086.1 hypothetical protein C490_08846 [Natronobacterium gregoryi SP2]PLK19100.1 hypothetical protein CYV19_16595 [Natronobacterium gregoryi SP2]SFI90138.1 hypothetical protein SAMN05443661_1097 [Natronobacterium gregoryi]